MPSSPSPAAGTPRPLVLESTSQGPRLRVRFVWHGDRFQHLIEHVHSADQETLLVSVEGPPGAAAPVSPPLQQLHIEDRPGGVRVALLVGMAGRNHWSLSVEAAADGRSLLFDAACRRDQLDIPLQSGYQIPGGIARGAMISEHTFRGPARAWEVRTCRAGGEPPADLTEHDSHLAILPVRSLHRTVRWMYRIMLEDRAREQADDRTAAPGSVL